VEWNSSVWEFRNVLAASAFETPRYFQHSTRHDMACQKTITPKIYFDVHLIMHCVKFLVIKPTRCTNFSSLFLEWNSTCFRHFLCPSLGVFHCAHSNGICHTSLLTACEQDQNGTAVPFWICSQAVSRPVWDIPLLCVQWKIPDDGQWNCPKHVEFQSKNKFEKLVHLVRFIIRNKTLVDTLC